MAFHLSLDFVTPCQSQLGEVLPGLEGLGLPHSQAQAIRASCYKPRRMARTMTDITMGRVTCELHGGLALNDPANLVGHRYTL